MSVFIDTGVFFAQHDEDATRHTEAKRAMRTVLSGKFGQPYTSDYVFDEAVTLTRKRAGNYEAARSIGRRILGLDEYPDGIELIHLSSDLFDEGFATLQRYHDHSLSFTDACTIALVKDHEMDAVLSFDDDFDGIIDRLDPTTV